jgi:hypothetical protein
VARSQEGATVAKADGGLVFAGDDNRRGNRLAFGQAFDSEPFPKQNME